MSKKTKIILLGLLFLLFIGLTSLSFFDEQIKTFTEDPNVILWALIATFIALFVGILSMPDNSSNKPDTEQEKTRNELEILLKRVENLANGRLQEESIRQALLIDIGWKSQPLKVKCIMSSLLESSQDSLILSGDEKIDELFAKANQKLLILGKPGAGKSTLLARLAQKLASQAHADKTLPIPVILSLASWATHQGSLSAWIAQELKATYNIPLPIGEKWIKDNSLLPLLDGLDEVQETARLACVKAINTFMEEPASLTGVAVCCREEEYEQLSETAKLCLHGAIHLQPLTWEQISDYLFSGNEALIGLWNHLDEDMELRKLAESPLMLSVMSLTYYKQAKTTITFDDTTDKRSQIFEKYIERMFARDANKNERNQKRYPQAQVLQGLTWLATQMKDRDQAIFLLEDLQPDWLPSRWGFPLLSGLSVGLLIGLLAVWQGASRLVIPIAGLIAGLFVGTVMSIDTSLQTKIEMPESLHWSWHQFRQTWLAQTGAVLLILMPLFGALIFIGQGKSAWQGLGYGLWFGLLSGLLFGSLEAGLVKQVLNPDDKTRVNQGVVDSLQNMWRFGIPFGIVAGVLFWLVLGAVHYAEFTLTTLLFYLFMGIIFMGISLLGGNAVSGHYTLRLLLFLERRTPWNYVAFLDHATRLIFLRRRGGGYEFIHLTFRDHFAERKAVSLAPLQANQT